MAAKPRRPANMSVAQEFGDDAFVQTLTFPVTLPGGTGAADQVTGFVMPFDFELLELHYVASVAGAGTSASRTFNMEIGTVDVDGALVLTLAGTALALVTSVALTANNVGSKGDAISIEAASGGTAFTGGSGAFVVVVRNRNQSVA